MMSWIIKNVDWYISVTLIVSILLGVASFVVPPTGVIDASVLAFIGELGTITALLTFLVKLPTYIEKGKKARIIKGDTTIEIGQDKEDL